MIKPNLPDSQVNKVIISSDASEEILCKLMSHDIIPIKLTGHLKCDEAVKNHPDLYLTHLNKNSLFFAKNNCSTSEELNNYIKTDFQYRDLYPYPYDAIHNCVALGNRLIGNLSVISREIIAGANNAGFELINVNQGYTKCNICIVDENSIITEDKGIYTTLKDHGFNILLLEKNAVKINKYSHGFIGGASGKISIDKLAFSGNIKLHPEYDRIFKFLYKKGVEPISLCEDVLFDYGSIIPIE